MRVSFIGGGLNSLFGPHLPYFLLCDSIPCGQICSGAAGFLGQDCYFWLAWVGSDVTSTSSSHRLGSNLAPEILLSFSCCSACDVETNGVCVCGRSLSHPYPKYNSASLDDRCCLTWPDPGSCDGSAEWQAHRTHWGSAPHCLSCTGRRTPQQGKELSLWAVPTVMYVYLRKSLTLWIKGKRGHLLLLSCPTE